MLVTRTEPRRSNASRAGIFRARVEDYQATGEVCGIGLREESSRVGSSAQPALHAGDEGAKRARHQHQRERGAALVGQAVLDRVRDLTLRLYAEGAAHAESCGIIVADTKFEFGLLRTQHHPDRRSTHARFLTLLAGATATTPARPEKLRQAIRPRLSRTHPLNKQPPVPSLPDEVVAEHARKNMSKRSVVSSGQELQ